MRALSLVDLAMPKHYSTDLRWRAVWLVLLRNMSYNEVSDILFMSERSVRRYVELYQHTGDVEPSKQKHGPDKVLNEIEMLIVIELLSNQPSIYLDEVQEELYNRTGTRVHNSTICRTMQHLGFSRKRLQRVALQCSDELRGQFMAEISQFDPMTFVWVDESGFNRRNTIRAYGYSLRGMRAVDHQLKHRGVNINSIGIMSHLGVEDVYLLERNVDGDMFEDFCRKCLIPILMPFNGTNTHSVVIMDNCSIHHTQRVTEMILSTGALLRFLPPYSPDLNPIEFVFSKVKSFVKANDSVFHFTFSPRTIVSMAFNTVTQEDCMHYIRHCGYTY